MLNVLVLAAGLGTRLRPLTDFVPKPLVRVVDAPILAHQARLAKTLGEVSLHVNAHHLAQELERGARELGFENVWYEPELLGTGGPIHRLFAEGVRGDLLVLNGDCYCHFDLQKFVETARASGAPVALLAKDFPSVNTLQISASRLAGILNRSDAQAFETRATFSGVSFYSERALSRIRASELDVRDFWERLIREGEAPFVDVSQQDALWVDMGTPRGLFEATKLRLRELGLERFVEAQDEHEGLEIAFGKNSVVYAGAKIGPGAELENCIVFEGGTVNAGEKVRHEILGKNFRWDLQNG